MEAEPNTNQLASSLGDVEGEVRVQSITKRERTGESVSETRNSEDDGVNRRVTPSFVYGSVV